jgi:hypothetical protein
VSDVMLSIPFIVLSTKVNPTGEVEKHVLTPFGDVDINVCLVSTQEAKGLALEVHVGEGIDCWRVTDPTIVPFRNTLVQFVGRMVQEMLGASLDDVNQVRIQFREDESVNIKLGN